MAMNHEEFHLHWWFRKENKQSMTHCTLCLKCELFPLRFVRKFTYINIEKRKVTVLIWEVPNPPILQINLVFLPLKNLAYTPEVASISTAPTPTERSQNLRSNKISFLSEFTVEDFINKYKFELPQVAV